VISGHLSFQDTNMLMLMMKNLAFIGFSRCGRGLGSDVGHVGYSYQFVLVSAVYS
jgi:hypothetical protein